MAARYRQSEVAGRGEKIVCGVEGCESFKMMAEEGFMDGVIWFVRIFNINSCGQFIMSKNCAF